MVSKKSTKKALLSSVICLILCVSMLVGTTFAWFTDSVSSGTNNIVAGNLDVEVYYDKDGTPTSIQDVKTLFNDVTLWEPGAVAYENITVVNEGTLALKYQMSINFTNENTVEGYGLSQVLKIAVVKDGFDESLTREQVLEKVEEDGDAEWQLLSAWAVNDYLQKQGDTHTYGVVIWWEPSADDNNWNVTDGEKYLHIDLGINLVATQKDAESDSFGTDYDKDLYPMEDGDVMRVVDDVQYVYTTDGEVMLYLVPADYQDETLYVMEGCTAIGDYAFAYNSNVKTVVLSSTVSDLGRGFDSSSVEKVILNEGLTTISSRAFRRTYNLETVVFSSTVTTIADNAFQSSGITNIAIPASVTTIGDAAFTDSAVETVSIEGENVYIDHYAFRDCENLTTITILSDTITLGSGMIFTNAQNNNADPNNITIVVTSEAVAQTLKENKDVKCTIVLLGEDNEVTDGAYCVEDTYYITNANGLKWFATEVNAPDKAEYEGNTFANKVIMLMNDIDLEGAEWDPIGNYGNTSKQFTGTFDGLGHTISNFKITQKTADRADKNRSPHGFFGNVNGTIKNLTLADANLTVTDDGRYAGVLVGRLHGGLIENCHVVDSYAEIDYWQIGGLVGQINAGTIDGCSVINTTVVGPAAVGAIVGLQQNTNEVVIQNCLIDGCTILQKGSFGEYYDQMFGSIVGTLFSENCTMKINNCTVTNTTIRGELSSTVYGSINEGAKLYIDGVLVVPPKVVEYDGSTGIQEVLNTLNSGDTLVISEGTYTTSGTFIVPAGVTIEAADGATVVFHQSSSAQDNIFNCEGDVTFRNITFESNRKGYAITDNTKNHDTDGNITVIGCTFKGIAEDKNWGIYKNLYGDLTIINCTFENYNNAICGVNNANGSVTVITGCTFTNCNTEAIGYVISGVAADFESAVIEANTGLTEDNVIGY